MTHATPFGLKLRWSGWLYILPAAALFIMFMVYPIIYNAILSLQYVHGTTTTLSAENYHRLTADPVFWTAIGNTLRWIVGCTIAEMGLGFGIAVVLEMYIGRGREWFRALLFLPMVITPTVIAIVFTTLYAPEYGLLYGMFRDIGLGSQFPALLGSTDWATWAIIAVNVWQWVGFFALLYCVGIQRIDPVLWDAAAIDGAQGGTLVRRIVFPLLRPTHLSLMILGAIQALQQFPLIYLMTEGGPAQSTQVLATYIFTRGYIENSMHFASALSIVLLVLALIIVGIQLLIAGGNFAVGGKNA